MTIASTMQDSTVTPQSKQTVAETVKSMQVHFASTGSYRGEDLVRVFGSPVEGVTATLQSTVPANSRKPV